MNIAIITARGGSKRIPRKNLILLDGKPIITYSIKAALDSKLFNKVIVSTDCPEIAKISEDEGAEIPFIRPANLSDDFTGTIPVIKHSLEFYNKSGVEFDFACCIYPTAPLIRVYDLKKGFENLQTSPNSDYSFPVTTFPFPPQRAVKIEDNQIFPFDSNSIEKRSQDLVELYHDAGQFYWGKTQSFIDEKPFFESKSIPIVVPRSIVQDLDTLEDLEILKVKLHFLKNKDSTQES